MKKLILTIAILFSIWTAQASNKFIKVEEWTEYTYKEGVVISLEISECLTSDVVVEKMITGFIARFEGETGKKDFLTLFLVMELSKKYRIGMEEKYISPKARKYIKSVVAECQKNAELIYPVESKIKYSLNDTSMTSDHPSATFRLKKCSEVTKREEIKACNGI